MAVYRPKYRDPKTGATKQQAVWWYEFIFAGERVRQSAKTTKKTIAVEAEKDHRRRLERASAGMPTEQPEQRIRTVASVLKDYEADYAVNHAERSARLVKDRARHADRLLGGLLLPDVTQPRLVDYIKKRREEGVGNRTINIELMILSRALGNTWKALWPKLKKLKENSDVGRALGPEEERRILDAASVNQSPLIHPFLVTLVWTGLRSDEARRLRWRQVDFEAAEVVVGKSKTEAGRNRVIPMSGALKAALEKHAANCQEQFGRIEPEWFVFPRCATKRPLDPKHPVGSLKKAWDSVRKAAECLVAYTTFGTPSAPSWGRPGCPSRRCWI
jgi:integrase